MVDLVIGAVQQDSADLAFRLPEPIDTPLTLFKPIGVPRQVVMDDRVELFLKVNSLAEAISGDKTRLSLSASSAIFSLRSSSPMSPVTGSTCKPGNSRPRSL